MIYRIQIAGEAKVNRYVYTPTLWCIFDESERKELVEDIPYTVNRDETIKKNLKLFYIMSISLSHASIASET
jgi:hypothetical protein